MLLPRIMDESIDEYTVIILNESRQMVLYVI